MALDMRALYYIALSAATAARGAGSDGEAVKAVENCLNQNFTIIAQKISELEARLTALEQSAGE